MRKAGGIVAIVAGGFGICCALFTLLLGAGAYAFQSSSAWSILAASGWGFMVGVFQIVWGAMAIHSAATAKVGGVSVGSRLCWVSIAGLLVGNLFGIIFAIMGLIGGILVRQEEKELEKVMPAAPVFGSPWGEAQEQLKKQS